MAGGGPGSNSRGRGGKFKKFTRGGGKHFSRDLRPLDEDGNEVGRKGPSDEESEESSSSEESGSESDAGPSTKTPAHELSREDRRKEKKARKDAAIARAQKPVEVGDMPPSDSESDDDDTPMPANPNHSRKARQQTKASSPAVDDAAAGVEKLSVSAPSRREREAMEAAAAKERYRKLHEAGKTDEAKADLARLKLIREKREAEAARKQAEKEELEEQNKAKRAEIDAREAKRREAALGPAAKKASKKK
ncbi:casein kinase substrate phosphoprotein PP28-domain-containing protein [Staphylotrichum tortipilum]|uniref:Casein kinase substrate phosphoprotein PP28-domain-containing protein n=1 Tax=Staphylotrichum tortipilum TaxID=2831512 RepID=A0AAN6MDA5_9PEZI|nr:casein kinase substrate phosphoprotein PP28-domain-containing protein [Staphylotrichum longicolle]